MAADFLENVMKRDGSIIPTVSASLIKGEGRPKPNASHFFLVPSLQIGSQIGLQRFQTSTCSSTELPRIQRTLI